MKFVGNFSIFADIIFGTCTRFGYNGYLRRQEVILILFIIFITFIVNICGDLSSCVGHLYADYR